MRRNRKVKVRVEHLNYLADLIEIQVIKTASDKLVSEDLRKVAKAIRFAGREDEAK